MNVFQNKFGNDRFIQGSIKTGFTVLPYTKHTEM